MSQIGRKGARRLPQLSVTKKDLPPGVAPIPSQQQNAPMTYMTGWYEIKELLRRTWQLENGSNNGGPGNLGQTFVTVNNEAATLPNSRRIVAGANITLTDGGAGGTLSIASTGGGGSTSPLTTKGDIWGFSTLDARVPVGADNLPLTANSGVALGVSYRVLPVAGGGTGDSTLTAHGVLVGEGTSAVAVTATGASGIPLIGQGAAADPVFGTAVVAGGGTGDTTLAAHGVLIGAGTSPVAVTAVGNTGQFLGGNTGADPTWQSLPATGTLQSQEFTTPGANTFNVPTGVTGVWINMSGGGGGGATTILAGTGAGGGGSGELVNNLLVPVSSGGTVTVTIGAKGTGGAAGQASAQPGTDGGDTSFGTVYIARGGKGAPNTGVSGAGGGSGGSAGKITGAPGVAGTLGVAETSVHFGGGSGGGGGSTTAAAGGTGSGAAGYPTGAAGGSAAGTQAGGGGGANSPWGVGGAGGNGGAIGNNAPSTSYGAGGGGGGGKATTTIGGGNGCAGYCLVVWVA